MKRVKTVAVVAYINQEPASKMISLSGNDGKFSSKMGGSSFYQMSEHADEFYNEFVKTLTKVTRWTVKPTYDVVNNPMYIDQSKKIMPAIQMMKLPPDGQNWYVMKGMMVPEAISAIGVDGRNKLASVLNVDAVVVVDYRTTIDSNYVNGIGPRRPQTKVDFQVFQRGRAEPIWDEWIYGEKPEESLGWFGFYDQETAARLIKESLGTALARVGTDPEAKK